MKNQPSSNDSNSLSRYEKKFQLYTRQKQLLDMFLEHGTISQSKYEEQLSELIEKTLASEEAMIDGPIPFDRVSLFKALDILTDSVRDHDYIPTPFSDRIHFCPDEPEEVFFSFQCSHCGEYSNIKVTKDSGREKFILRNYECLGDEYYKLNWPADVKCLCNSCADKLYPSRNSYSHNNIVFSVVRPGSLEPSISFPNPHIFSDYSYKIALAFLKGAITVDAISENTNTKDRPEVYLNCVKMVLFNGEYKKGNRLML